MAPPIRKVSRIVEEGLVEAGRELLDAYYKDNPAFKFIPNCGQELAFLPFKQAPYPFITVFGGGNGVGKTTAECIDACGALFGSDALPTWFDDYQFYDDLQEKARLRGSPVKVRLLCNADFMKPGGAILDSLKRWLPPGRCKFDKAGKTYVSQIIADNGNTIEVRTFDQDQLSHEGSNVDLTLCDEPLPQNLWPANVGRLRGGGRIKFYLTPLNMAGWMLDDIVDKADGEEIVVVNASLWDNCRDWHPDPKKWSGGKVGVGQVLTRGVLEKKDIDRQITEWTKTGPEELDARVWGKFSHLSGAIYKTYNPEVHLCKRFHIPEDWPVYCIIDPHDKRVPALAWFAQSKTHLYGFQEWPREDFTKMGTSMLTNDQVGDAMRTMEENFRQQVQYRIMDPNKGRMPSAITRTTVQDEFAKLGYYFDTTVTDDLLVGHGRVMSFLYYDTKRAPDPTSNWPYLQIFNDLINLPAALKKYSLKRNAVPGASLTVSVDQTYKDFADLIRYMAMAHQTFQPVNGANEFAARLKAGRISVAH